MLDKDKVEKIIIVLLIAVFAIFGWLQSRPAPEPDLQAVQGAESSEQLALVKPTEVTASVDETLAVNEQGTGPIEIFVHVDGAVQSPGLYKLHEGDRVQDALDKAGGVSDTGSLAFINLSAKLQDEMKIWVPTQEEVAQLEDKGLSPDQQGNLHNVVEHTDSQEDALAIININTATIEELVSLPGIGEAKAQAIVAYREEAPFYSIEEIMEVSGIGEKIFEQIKDRISVE